MKELFAMLQLKFAAQFQQETMIDDTRATTVFDSPVGQEMKSLVEIKNQIQHLEKLIRCKICLDRDACMAFFPCRHMATCEYCGSFLEKCPVCRALIEEAVKVNKKQ
ncbi:E3 ubiquitin-protein ligase XIAP-like [Ruditapes philippinarum]|uniref:E3 ubiquitin-protein ligase XIAP-like n=1 Tax=Ruditapes philippinarum TaxID=129788 RepID=UPI00295B1613|nr:E3 ubiquitin-protein ligase XIAP-like [Ruditapes philippinarum]